MSDAFLSSDDFDEQAHQLYNEGRYDDAIAGWTEMTASLPEGSEWRQAAAQALTEAVRRYEAVEDLLGRQPMTPDWKSIRGWC